MTTTTALLNRLHDLTRPAKRIGRLAQIRECVDELEEMMEDAIILTEEQVQKLVQMLCDLGIDSQLYTQRIGGGQHSRILRIESLHMRLDRATPPAADPLYFGPPALHKWRKFAEEQTIDDERQQDWEEWQEERQLAARGLA